MNPKINDRRINPPNADSAVAKEPSEPCEGRVTGAKDDVQGEGDYAAARAFNEAERKFVASGRVDAAALVAAPRTEAERLAMLEAETAGKARAVGESTPSRPSTKKATPPPLTRRTSK